MDTVVNPLRSSIKQVGRAVSTDSLVDGIGKVFNRVSRMRSITRSCMSSLWILGESPDFAPFSPLVQSPQWGNEIFDNFGNYQKNNNYRWLMINTGFINIVIVITGPKWWKYEAVLVFSKSTPLRGVKGGDSPPLEVQQLDMYARLISNVS